MPFAIVCGSVIPGAVGWRTPPAVAAVLKMMVPALGPRALAVANCKITPSTRMIVPESPELLPPKTIVPGKFTLRRIPIAVIDNTPRSGESSLIGKDPVHAGDIERRNCQIVLDGNIERIGHQCGVASRDRNASR